MYSLIDKNAGSYRRLLKSDPRADSMEAEVSAMIECVVLIFIEPLCRLRSEGLLSAERTAVKSTSPNARPKMRLVSCRASRAVWITAGSVYET